MIRERDCVLIDKVFDNLDADLSGSIRLEEVLREQSSSMATRIAELDALCSNMEDDVSKHLRTASVGHCCWSYLMTLYFVWSRCGRWRMKVEGTY